jgi:hypothetical protein
MSPGTATRADSERPPSTPWEAVGDHIRLPESGGFRRIAKCDMGGGATADLIVTAVNHHAELVTMVRTFVRASTLTVHRERCAQARELLARIDGAQQ